MERRVTLSKATSAATVMSVMSVTDAKLVSLILKLMSRKDFLTNMHEFAFIICMHMKTNSKKFNFAQNYNAIFRIITNALLGVITLKYADV